MKTLEIKNSGNFQKDVNEMFDRFCPVRTESWSNLTETIYVGFVRVGMYDYVIDSESAFKISTNTLKVGDVVKLTTEATAEVGTILNQESFFVFQTQYDVGN